MERVLHATVLTHNYIPSHVSLAQTTATAGKMSVKLSDDVRTTLNSLKIKTRKKSLIIIIRIYIYVLLYVYMYLKF